jgi:hypothetical protein
MGRRLFGRLSERYPHRRERQILDGKAARNQLNSANRVLKTPCLGGDNIMDHEKRNRERVPVQFDVGIVLGKELIKVQIINISLTGILCTSSSLFQKDAPCKVVISLRDDLRITVDAKILRVGKQETAISFTAMDEESFAHLKRVVQYNAGDADRIDREFQRKAFD